MEPVPKTIRIERKAACPLRQAAFLMQADIHRKSQSGSPMEEASALACLG